MKDTRLSEGQSKMKMKKTIMIIMMVTGAMLLVSRDTAAQTPVAEAIKAGVKKVIKAIDLKIQRIQNKTIWLQNAQKVMENTMSKLKLDEISSWVEKQRTLYKGYYEELARIKSIITYYQRIRDMTQKQKRLVKEYTDTWYLLKQDMHFTTDELTYMAEVYTGILKESAQNMDQLLLVISSFTMEMTDAKRLELIHEVDAKIGSNYDDLRQFNQENKILSLQRSGNEREAATIKELYGIQYKDIIQ